MILSETGDDQEEPDMSQVMKETSLMQIVCQTLQIDVNAHSLARYMKLEALWILINLSVGDDEDVDKMLQKEYDILKPF